MDNRSVSSRTLNLSSLNISARNFNPMASVPAGVIEQLKKDGEVFLGCLKYCDRLWKAMRKNDLYSQGEISLGAL
jgi:hypothetical protein